MFSRSAGGVGVVTAFPLDLVESWDIICLGPGLGAISFVFGDVSSSSTSEVSSSLSSLIDSGRLSNSERPRSDVGLVGFVCLLFFDPEALEGNSHCLLPLRHP